LFFSCQTFELPRNKRKFKRKKIDDDFDSGFEADDESEDQDIKKNNKLVMKVVKQGDTRHKQSSVDNENTLGDIEQDIFLPKNLTFARDLIKKNFNNDIYDEDYDEDDDDGKASKKAVFEMPRKPLSSYTKWSRWTKCSPKCITRRFKKCRPHAYNICGNDVIREIAYCYTEGSFCEEWISSQINKIGNSNSIEVTSTRRTTTTRLTTTTTSTQSPLENSVSQNFGRPTSGRRRKPKTWETKPQNLQCGFPSIRNKNSDFLLKIIGGRAARRGQV
jgi:hypothetical protein